MSVLGARMLRLLRVLLVLLVVSRFAPAVVPPGCLLCSRLDHDTNYVVQVRSHAQRKRWRHNNCVCVHARGFVVARIQIRGKNSNSAGVCGERGE
jgi:hypothetical protein